MKVTVCKEHFEEIEKRKPKWPNDNGPLGFCVMCKLGPARNHYGVKGCILVDSEKIPEQTILRHELEMTLWRYPTLNLAEGALVTLLKQRFPNRLIARFLLPR